MNARLIDLRRRPGLILEAVARRETVILSRRGKPIAKIGPLTDASSVKPQGHEAFGLWRDRAEVSVAAQVENLRAERFRDL